MTNESIAVDYEAIHRALSTYNSKLFRDMSGQQLLIKQEQRAIVIQPNGEFLIGYISGYTGTLFGPGGIRAVIKNVFNNGNDVAEGPILQFDIELFKQLSSIPVEIRYQVVSGLQAQHSLTLHDSTKDVLRTLLHCGWYNSGETDVVWEMVKDGVQ